MKINQIPKLTEADIRRFWSKVDKREVDECWLWTGAPTPDGYGRFKIAKRMYPAHRIAFALSNPLEPNQFVCHRCDVPLCCNLSHLFAGSSQDNFRDAIDKGRIRKPLNAWLTETDAAQIRLLYAETELSLANLSAMYDVSKGQIWKIVQNRTWI